MTGSATARPGGRDCRSEQSAGTVIRIRLDSCRQRRSAPPGGNTNTAAVILPGAAARVNRRVRRESTGEHMEK